MKRYFPFNYFKLKRLKDKLMISHSITIISVIFIMQVLIYNIAYNMQIQDARNLNLQIVRQISISLEKTIMPFARVINYITMDDKIQNLLQVGYGSNKTLKYELDRQLYSHAVHQTIFIHELDSLYLYDNENLRAYFKRYYQKDQQYNQDMNLSKYHFSDTGKVTWRLDGDTVFFERKIISLDELKSIGYLRASLNKIYIKEKIKEIKANPKRFIVITDENNQIIEHNSEDEKSLSYILKNIHEPKNQRDFIQDIDGVGKLLITTHYSEYLDWKIISIISIDELTKGPKILSKWILIIGVLGLIIGIIFSLLGSSQLTKPLKEMTILMQEVERENFDIEFNVQSSDELGLLGKSFNRMVRKINTLILKVYQEELSLKDAEISALQAQINPHFLYNTLDCINWLVDSGNIDEVRTITTSLANLMKVAARNKKKFITVQEEMQYIKAYLDIYKVSLQDKFEYYIDIDPRILKQNIPKLILQPIIENAILHGIKQKIGFGSLQVKGIYDEEKMIFEVFDDGVGMSEKQINLLLENNELEDMRDKRNTIGLRNVMNRIRLIYGIDGVNVQSQEDIGTMIEISIPIKGEDKDEII